MSTLESRICEAVVHKSPEAHANCGPSLTLSQNGASARNDRPLQQSILLVQYDEEKDYVVPAIFVGWCRLCCPGPRMPSWPLRRRAKKPESRRLLADSGYAGESLGSRRGRRTGAASTAATGDDCRLGERQDAHGGIGGLFAFTSAFSWGMREPRRRRRQHTNSTSSSSSNEAEANSDPWHKALCTAGGVAEQSETGLGKSAIAEPLPRAALESLRSSTGFSLRRIHDWNVAFQGDCPSGEMVESDFAELFHHFYPDGSAEDWAKHLFRSFDYERRGKLDFKHFLYMTAVIRRGTLAQHICWAFDLYDVDDVGLITTAGMMTVLRCIQSVAGYEIGGASARELAGKFLLDANGHGFEVVDLKQFMSAVMADGFMLNIALDLV